MERIQGRVQVDTLLKHIIPQVDIGRATQLNTLFSNLQKKAINIENFIRLAKDIVGNQLIAEGVEKMQIQLLFFTEEENRRVCNTITTLKQKTEVI